MTTSTNKTFNAESAIEEIFSEYWDYECKIYSHHRTLKAVKDLFYLKETGLRSDSVCKKISEQLKASKSMVITLGDKGIFYKDQDSRGKIPAYKLKAADVSGAGDTVIAALAISMLEGQDLRTMAEFANKAGALSCSKDGVSSVSVKEIRRFKANK